MSNGDPIIIKGGGSVAIGFNESHYTGKDGRYYSPDATIVRVEIVNDDTGEVRTTDAPGSGKCTVKIHTR